MAAKYAVLALAAICIAQASAASHVRRSAEDDNTLEQMMENARTQIPEASELVRCEHVDAPSVDEVVLGENMTKEVEEGTKSVSDENITQMETQGSELSESGNAALLEDTVQLNESLNGMKRSKRETAVETMMTETGKIARTTGDDAGSVHDELANLSKSAMEQTLSLLGQFHNDVQAAVTRATSS